MNNITELDQALKSVCPIDGVSIGDADNKATWRIDFRPEATKEQQDAARAVMAAFVYAEKSEPLPLETRLAALESKVIELNTSIGVLVK